MKNLKDKLVSNMVRDETDLQFFLLKHKVDWNVRYETLAGKAWPRETTRADRPRKASSLRSNQQSDLLTMKKETSNRLTIGCLQIY
ncbi:hypothetical protein AB9M92_20530 [Peribacillus frigoritolerans]|uniref:hypothetical protein n=1 Tax=Peribacillus frigoritolerans TaxID=450367 RepID=UPI00351895BA